MKSAVLCGIALFFVTAGVPSFAQTTLGTITGRVLDSSGAAVNSAGVAATNTGTHVVYHTTTNDTGNYVLQQLAIGSYELAVEAKRMRVRFQRKPPVAIRYLDCSLCVRSSAASAFRTSLSLGSSSKAVCNSFLASSMLPARP